MKYLLVFLAVTALPDWSCNNNITEFHNDENKTLKVSDVLDRIKANVTCDWKSQTVDNLKSGSLDDEVTGIATTFMATVDVMKKAHAQGINMIITHEPTFYNHFDNLTPLKNDPVQEAKLKLIEEYGLIVFRYHDHMHATSPDGINQGWIDDLGWEALGNSAEMVFDIEDVPLSSLSHTLSEHFKSTTIRVIGGPDQIIDHVGVVPGSWGSLKQIEWMNIQEVDALIVGESREWETVEYARDLNALGMNKGLIVLGHADSEEPGMAYCASWLKGFINEVPIKHLPAGDPFWSPEEYN